ncbi:MAG: peptidoglycan bridge formation glycyltransferase FemA/FemB family protein [bacterium]
MNYQIVGDKDRAKWNEFVSLSDYSPILQSYEWGELKGSFGWTPIRIALLDSNNHITAAASILKRKIPGFNKSLFYCPRGPVVNYNDKVLVNDLLIAIRKEAKKHNAVVLKIDPDIHEDMWYILTLLKELGFKKAMKQIQPRATMILDLCKSLDSLMETFEQKTRYNIRLALKKGVKVKEETSAAGVRNFYAIHQETSQRDEFLIHPLKYYEKVQELMGGSGMARIFTAYYEGHAIASVFIFYFGKRVWYMFGASSSKYRNVMPNHALHYEVIRWAKEHGYSTYDFWGIPAAPSEDHPLFGVYRFKKGFNGKLIKLIGVYDLPFNYLWYILLERGIYWYQNLRSLITKGKISDSLGE